MAADQFNLRALQLQFVAKQFHQRLVGSPIFGRSSDRNLQCPAMLAFEAILARSRLGSHRQDQALGMFSDDQHAATCSLPALSLLAQSASSGFNDGVAMRPVHDRENQADSHLPRTSRL